MLQTAIPVILFFTTILHTSPSLADYTYTVHSTFLFLRTGDRTPRTLSTTASTLTPYGAQQLFSAGTFFRDRYITNSFSASNATSDLNTSPISGISVNTALDEQLYLLAMDKQFAIASATAFMQGFYPPFSVMNDGNGNNLGEGDGGLTTLNQLGLLGNGTYVSAYILFLCCLCFCRPVSRRFRLRTKALVSLISQSYLLYSGSMRRETCSLEPLGPGSVVLILNFYYVVQIIPIHGLY